MSVATSPFRCAGPMPATIPLDPVTALDAPSARWSVPSACRHVCYILPISPECRCAGRILSASYPSSNSAPPSNPHSAVAPPVPNLPRLRALALFGRRPPQRVEEFVMPASKNLHRSGNIHSFAQGRRALGRNHLRHNRRNPPSIYAHRMRQPFPKLRLCPIL